MTEAEWLTSDHHQTVSLVNFANGTVCSPAYPPIQRPSSRKLLLLACACYRRVSVQLMDAVICAGIDTAEQFAEGLLSESEFRAAIGTTRALVPRLTEMLQGTSTRAERSRLEAAIYVAQAVSALDWPPASAAVMSIHYVSLAMKYWAKSQNWAARPTANKERKAQLLLLRDIVGNPFRPVTLDPAWRTSTVLAIAQGMYESRDFSAMPILADALQDAGSDSEDILNHCRNEKAMHVRGCWVIDLVLGKA